MILISFVFTVDVLQIAVVHALLAEFCQQQDRERGIEVAESGGPVTVLKHHALRKAGRGVVIAEAGK